MGYHIMMKQLSDYLKSITKFDGFSFMPNSGASGEYTGLMTIRKYLDQNGWKDKNICLIPQSAHGTNPASAALSGMKVVVINSDSKGNIDLVDLEQKV